MEFSSEPHWNCFELLWETSTIIHLRAATHDSALFQTPKSPSVHIVQTQNILFGMFIKHCALFKQICVRLLCDANINSDIQEEYSINTHLSAVNRNKWHIQFNKGIKWTKNNINKCSTNSKNMSPGLLFTCDTVSFTLPSHRHDIFLKNRPISLTINILQHIFDKISDDAEHYLTQDTNSRSFVILELHGSHLTFLNSRLVSPYQSIAITDH